MSRIASSLNTAPTRPDLTRPGYIASPDQLARLLRRRRVRRVFRDLERGKWRRVLLDLKNTQFLYRDLSKHDGTIDSLLTKINVVRSSTDLLATVLVGNPPTISVSEGAEAQRSAVEEIRQRSLFDTLIHRAARVANVEGEAAIRVDVVPGVGTTLCLDNNDETLPVGPDGPDGQPTVWERRWIVERVERGGKKRKFLRVERHRAPDGVGVIEQEAYETSDVETIVDLRDLTRVPLERAFVAGADVPHEVVETGVPYPLVVRLVNDFYDDEPATLVPEDDIDQLDMLAKSVSQLARSFAIHGEPKMRVSSEAVDPDTGLVNMSRDAVVDDAGKVEYIGSPFNMEAMLSYMTRMLGIVLANLKVSPALLGIRLDGGATPDSYEKLRLEATGTLAAAKKSAMYQAPAVARLWTVATIFDSRRPLRGYAAGPVTAEYHPEIPKDRLELVREVREELEAGLIDERTAIVRIHGEAHADRVIAGIVADREARAERDQRSVFGAFGGGA